MSTTDHYKTFCSYMDSLSRRHDVGRVFNDLTTMAVCSLHQINIASRCQDKDPDNEKLYMETIKAYERDELNVFAKLLGCIQLHVFDNPYDDLLGRYFTEFITQGQNGQFFTPTSVARLITQLSTHEDVPEEGKTIYDPACGSGRLILEFARVAPNNYFYANDVSQACAKMTAINFMLNGLRGEVAWMNTLSMEFYGAWRVNVPTLGITLIEKEQSNIWAAPRSKQSPTQSNRGDQLTLF